MLGHLEFYPENRNCQGRFVSSDPANANSRGDKALAIRLTRARALHLANTGVEITWEELAQLVGLSKTAMSDVKNAKRGVQIREVARMAEVLGVRAAWLAFGEEPMAPTEPVRGSGAPAEPPPSPDPFGGLRAGKSRSQPADAALEELRREEAAKEAAKQKRRPTRRTG
jgi:transcriptional regulator with XRE-family HTH domain